MNSTATIEPAYVVDTHALIWYMTNDKKLGKQASRIFSAAEMGETQLVISAITLAELYWMNKKHQIFKDFGQTYRQLRSNPQYQFHPFTADDVLDFDQNAAVPEMHDRIIAGLARRLGVTLVTLDPSIMAANVVRVIW